MNKNRLRYLFLIVFFIITAIIASNHFFAGRNQNSGVVSLGQLNQPEATPMPFDELTIPHLRNRDYQSSLKDLNQIAETQNYTTYLTAYDSDGLNINGLLTIPKGQAPETGWPAVVFIHGYIPPNEYRSTEKYGDYVDYLARSGLVVFKIDLRGHGDSEGEAEGAYYSSAYIIDTLNAAAALSAADFVDEGKIGLWGHSMAGNVVLRAMATKLEIKAGVIFAGAVYTYQDMTDYGISDNSYQRPPDSSPRSERRQNLFDTHGRFDPESDFWRQVAPTEYLGDLTGALQIHHAENDSVVSIYYSHNLSKLLAQNQVEHEIYTYTTGGHNLSSPAFSTAMARTALFFQSKL